jgi:hypothetical protein
VPDYKSCYFSAEDTAQPATPLVPLGISVIGVAMYNQNAGCKQSVTNNIISFDQYYGHPDPTATYHYNIEPINITLTQTKSALVGFLLDGFPV